MCWNNKYWKKKVFEVWTYLAVTSSRSRRSWWTRGTSGSWLTLSRLTLEISQMITQHKPVYHKIKPVHKSVLFHSERQPFGLWHQRFLDFLGNLVAQGGPGNENKRTKHFNVVVIKKINTSSWIYRSNTYIFSILSWITLNHKKQSVTLT